MFDLKAVLVFFLLAGATIAVFDQWHSNMDVAAPSLTGVVNRVVDGDSLYIVGLDVQVRLFGVDAPERDERGYRDAKRMLAQLVRDDAISCNQVDEDRFKRIVARCFMLDGREISAAMIDSGTAEEYCRYSHGFYGGC